MLDSMDLTSITNERAVSIRADVVANAKPDKNIKAYIPEVAIDIVQLAPTKLCDFLTREDRKNMALISIVAMDRAKGFAISAPSTITKLLLANNTSTIECDDDNIITLKFVPADAAPSATRGSFLWCHATIGPFDSTTIDDLTAKAAIGLRNLGLIAVRFKPVINKVAGTWLKKLHIDLEADPNIDRSRLCFNSIDLPDGMRATFDWGKDLRNHFGLCAGPCARVITSIIYDRDGSSYDETDKSACLCKKESGEGESWVDKKRKSNSIWERRMSKKKATSAGAGASSDIPPPPPDGAN